LVVVVCGQTASGKSLFCRHLASRIGGVVVSMDALKVYRGMDIGTAKDRVDGQGVPVRMIDQVAPHELFNVSMYLNRLEAELRDVVAQGKTPVIDCGTPLYLRAFLSGMLDGPEPDGALRASLDARESEELHAELAGRDPDAAARLHPNDRKRVIRALEFAIQTGSPISSRQTQWTERRRDYRMVLTGPLWPAAALAARIARRVDGMMAEGLLEEVQKIAGATGFSRTAGEAIGYRQLLDHLEGKVSLAEAVERTKLKTRQLARAQLKWFRRYPDIKWLLMNAGTDDAVAEEELRRAAVFLAQELAPLLPSCAVPGSA
jgi:tRNA dimethylallyltransferase